MATFHLPMSAGARTEEKRNSCLRKLAMAQVVVGSGYGLFIFFRTVTFGGRNWYRTREVMLLLLLYIPAFLVIVAGSLLICCKCKGNWDPKCKLRGHFILAVVGCIFLLPLSFEEGMNAGHELYNLYTNWMTYNSYHGIICRFFIAILGFTNSALLTWSAVVSGKELTCRKNQSNTNFQHQVVYVQQGTPENPQLIMMQPCAQPMLPVQSNINGVQPIQPHFNGTVPSTAVITQHELQSVQVQEEDQQTTRSPNQDINNRDSSPEVDDVTTEAEPETSDVSTQAVEPETYYFSTPVVEPEAYDVVNTFCVPRVFSSNDVSLPDAEPEANDVSKKPEAVFHPEYVALEPEQADTMTSDTQSLLPE